MFQCLFRIVWNRSRWNSSHENYQSEKNVNISPNHLNFVGTSRFNIFLLSVVTYHLRLEYPVYKQARFHFSLLLNNFSHTADNNQKSSDKSTMSTDNLTSIFFRFVWAWKSPYCACVCKCVSSLVLDKFFLRPNEMFHEELQNINFSLNNFKLRKGLLWGI